MDDKDTRSNERTCENTDSIEVTIKLLAGGQRRIISVTQRDRGTVGFLVSSL